MSAKEKSQRSCVSCGNKNKKGNLFRVVCNKLGGVSVDKKGTMAGRGAYVCSKDCFEAAVQTKRLERALKNKIAPDDYERLIVEFDAMMRDA